MKKTKKMLIAILSVLMVIAMSVPAFAADITITNPKAGQTYKAYKLLNYRDITGSTQKEYYLSTAEYNNNGLGAYLVAAGVGFTKSGDEYIVTTKPADDTFINYLRTHEEGLASKALSTDDVTAGENDKTVKLEGLDQGYYFISSTTGALITLKNVNADETITDKNDTHIEKTVTGGDATTPSEENTANVGDKLTYTVDITAQKGSEKYVFFDKLSDGLTLDTSTINVKVGNTSLNEGTDYNLTTTASDSEDINGDGNDDPYTFKITFTDDYLKGLTAETHIIVTYDATINDSALSLDKVNNKANLSYGHDKGVVSDETKTYLYGFKILKVDASNVNTKLDGVEFTLKDKDGKYYNPSTKKFEEVAEGSTAPKLTTADGGSLDIRGLEAGTYTLTETNTLGDYVLLSTPVTIKITKGTDGVGTLEVTGPTGISKDKDTTGNSDTAVVTITIKNTKKGDMPFTGGMGTTILYVAGGILIAVAVGAYVMKKRNGAAE
jgi:fimbrial isopeptide formation D2 family protein